MWNLLYLTFSLCSAKDPKALIISSSLTPPDLLIKLKSSSLSESISFTFSDITAISEPTLTTHFLIIDATFSIISGLTLESLSKTYQISYVSLHYSVLNSNQKIYSLIPAPGDLVPAIKSLLDHLNWSNFAVFSSEDDFNTECSDKLLEDFHELRQQFYVIADDFDEKELENMLSKLIKPSNIKVFVIFAKESATRKLLSSFKNKKMLNEGNGVLLYGESNIDFEVEGLIGVVPEGLEKLYDSSSLYTLVVKKLIEFIESNILQYSNQDLLNQIIKKYLTGLKPNSFSILNFKNTKRKTVGSIVNQQISLKEDILYLGGVSNFTLNFRTPIYLGYAGGKNNGGSIPPTGFNPGQMNGAVFASQIANNDSSLLPYFEFFPVYTDCGVNTNNETFIYGCLDQFQQITTGFLSTAWYPSTVPYVKYFSPMPVIGTDTSIEMSNKTGFPTFIRVTAPSTYNVVVIMTVIKIYGWKQVAVLCTNIPKFVSMCELFKSLAKTNNIKIINDESLWLIENFYTRDRFDQDKDKMQEIINCGARIFVALIPSADLYQLMEGFYDLGMRNGDLQILLQSKTGGNICDAGLLTEYCDKRKETLSGLVGVYMAEWSGTYGKKMQEAIIPVFGSYTDFKCTAFDQGMLLINTIANVINMGYDYEDATIMNSYMRRIRFVGCSGTVSISQGTNDRSNQPTYVMNLIVKNGTFVEYQTAIYNPSSQNPFETFRPVIWTGDKTEVPDDYRFSLNCPFNEDEAGDSDDGFTALYLICFIFGIYLTIITVLYMKFLHKNSIEMINSRTLITGQDMSMFFFIVIEVFQYFSLGVTPSDSSSIVKSLSDITGINFRSFLRVTGDDYWKLIMVVIILTWCLQAICVMVILRSKRVILLRSSVFNCLDFFSEYILPMYGEICFIPIVSVILDMYTCTKSIKSGLTNSYNDHDCNTYCWQGSHLSFSVLGILTLAVFIPFFIFLRPNWQNNQKSLNIKQNPRYVMCKSIFQMFAIILSKTVFHSDEVVFGYIFTFYILIYACCLRFVQKYSYDICNFWLIISLLITSYTELLYSISLVSTFEGKYVAVTLFIGWVVIGLACAFIQSKYYVSLLYSEPSKNIPEIFEYAFRNNGSKYIDDKQDSQYN